MALYRHLATGTTPGETWTFSLHTQGELSLAAAQTAWVDGTGAMWTGALDALLAPEVVMTQASTAELVAGTGAQTTRVITDVTRPGVAAAEMLPFQCATAVSLRTQFATRAGRGRFYLPPLAVTTVEDGLLSTTSQNAVLTAASNLMGSLTTDGLTPVVYSRTAFTTTTVTTIDVGNVIDTQRRRRNKLIEARVSAIV